MPSSLVGSPSYVGTISCSRLTGVSTDSQFSHFAWAQQPKKLGGLGPDLKLPLVADRNMKISRDYDVLIEEEGISLRGLFIIDPKGIVRYANTGTRRTFNATYHMALGRSRSMTCRSVVLSKKPFVCCRRSNLRFV